MLRVTVAQACSNHPQLGALHGKPEGHPRGELGRQVRLASMAGGQPCPANRAACRAAPTAGGGRELASHPEPALSAWVSDRSGPLTTLTWASDSPLVTVIDPVAPEL